MVQINKINSSYENEQDVDLSLKTLIPEKNIRYYLIHDQIVPTTNKDDEFVG